MKTATTTTTPGTLTLVARWNKDDYYTLIKNNGETVITGSGHAGLIRAVKVAKCQTADYSHIRWESDASYIIYNLDGTRTDDPVSAY